MFDDLQNQYNTDLLNGKTVYCAVGDACCQIHLQNGIVMSEEVPALAGKHEEADTRVAFHTKYAITKGSQSVTVRVNDTDILVILLSSCQFFGDSSVFMDVGVGSNNSRRFIDVM